MIQIKIEIEIEDNQSMQIVLNNPVFQDLETQKRVMIQIAKTVTAHTTLGKKT